MKKLIIPIIVFLSFSLLSASETELRDKIVETAKSYLGTKYKFTGKSEAGFDCSGFCGFVFSVNGLTLPRSSGEIFKEGEKIDIENAKPGDLVFFKIRKNAISHVGIYLGDGNFIHSPSSGRTVCVEYIGQEYWRDRLAGFASYITKGERNGSDKNEKDK